MRRGPRGGPGDFDARLARAEKLAAASAAAREPLLVAMAVLRHQRQRAEEKLVQSAADAAASGAAVSTTRGGFPRLYLTTCLFALRDELALAVGDLAASAPAPLAREGRVLAGLPPVLQAETIETWLDDPSLVDPRSGFWLGAAAAPILELAARAHGPVSDDEWRGAACPMCGGPPQASAIAEESGEFMAGSPRSLVCGRCATWWSYPRITCPSCGEEDPRRAESFLPGDRRWVRVDACETCRGYVKSFDLREQGAGDVVPLVDDIATLALDVWAQDRGFTRPTVSLAGV
ncbi:MAG: formate dehydrogenase accessory protein FdhE [Acidimicrobiales bacterium]